jgi:hypothetical protein
MNTPTPRQPDPMPHTAAGELQMHNWLALRRELAELHARLEYLNLILRLGVSR